MYTTSHLVEMFGISHQTVKNYCAVFAEFLSPIATPGKNRQRQFTDDDVMVIALIVEMKKARTTFEVIHQILSTGQRGTMPDMNTPSIPESASAVMVLRQQIADIQEELDSLRSENAKQAGQIELLERMLERSQQRVIGLERENARRDDHD